MVSTLAQQEVIATKQLYLGVSKLTGIRYPARGGIPQWTLDTRLNLGTASLYRESFDAFGLGSGIQGMG